VKHYLTVQQRSQDKNKLPSLNRLIKQYINADIKCAEWLIKDLTSLELIKELILECPERKMAKFTTGLIYAAMVVLYEKDKASINLCFEDIGKVQPELERRTTLGDFMIMLINYLPKVKEFIAHQAQYLQLIAGFARLGPEARYFLLRLNTMQQLLNMMYS